MYFLGVDGGGSKTNAVLSDLNGSVLRMAKAGACNAAVLSREQVARRLRELLAELLRDEDTAAVRGATLGLAGVGRQEERDKVRGIVSDLGLRDANMLSDAELLYYAMHGDEVGILVAAGTGSVCVIRRPSGEFQQLGGWGYLLGDEGSGYDLGRRAIRQALVEAERGAEASLLTRRLLEFFGGRHPRDLISQVYRAENPQNFVAGCAALTCDLALEGEPNARKLVETTARQLLDVARRASKRLESAPPYRLGLAGSLLSQASPVTASFERLAKAAEFDVEYVRPSLEAAAAGVLHAVQAAGERAPESLLARLRQVTF